MPSWRLVYGRSFVIVTGQNALEDSNAPPDPENVA